MEYVLQAFLDDIELAGNAHQLRAVLAAVAVGLGLDSYAYMALASSPSKRPKLISSYDIRWTDYYLGKRYEQRDPVIGRALRDPKSFEWGPDTDWPGTSIWIRNFFHEAASFGIHAGLTIPMGGWQGGHAALTFAADCRSAVSLLGQ